MFGALKGEVITLNDRSTQRAILSGGIVLQVNHVADLAFSPMPEVVFDRIDLVFLVVVGEFLCAFLQNLFDLVRGIDERSDGIEGDSPLQVMEGLIVVLGYDCVDRPINVGRSMTIAGGSVTGWLFLGGRFWGWVSSGYRSTRCFNLISGRWSRRSQLRKRERRPACT